MLPHAASRNLSLTTTISKFTLTHSPSHIYPHTTHNRLDMYQPPPKKRKIDRACDACRRRKSKCNGPTQPDRICSHCRDLHKPCTYLEQSKPRGPPKAVITALEDKLERLEALLLRLRPECNFSSELGPVVIRDSWRREDSPGPQAPAAIPGSVTFGAAQLYTLSDQDDAQPGDSARSSASLDKQKVISRKSSQAQVKREAVEAVLPSGGSGDSSPAGDSDGDASETDDIILRFSHGFAKLNLGTPKAPQHDDNNARYAGKSSNISTIRAAQIFKEKHIEELLREQDPLATLDAREEAKKRMPHVDKRPEFWFIPPWEERWEQSHFDNAPPLSSFLSRFPPLDLAEHLIDLYFARVNPILPLLHGPTFKKLFSSNHYRENNFFAALCFSVFAVASRWSDDPRVLMEHNDGNGPSDLDWRTAGFKYLQDALGIHRAHRSLIRPVTLFEIQMYTLIGVYMRGSSQYTTSWLFSGGGICKLFDIGAHRKPIYGAKVTTESELFKRAFWVLFTLDRFESAMLGRPCSIGDEQFDTDFPLDVDDEFWEPHELSEAFKQPLEKPSIVSGFNLLVKLMQLISRVLRTMYATNEASTPLQINAGSVQTLVNSVNDSMTEWINSVPAHLKWSSSMPDETFANQSTTLFVTYYFLQILLYRPFIHRRRIADQEHIRNSSSPPPTAHEVEVSANASAICTNAAQRCAHIIRHQMQRDAWDSPTLISISHYCAATLLGTVWQSKLDQQEAKRRGDQASFFQADQTVATLMKDVNTFCDALRHQARSWDRAGHLLRNLESCLPPLEQEASLAEPLHSSPPDANHYHLHPQADYRHQTSSNDSLHSAYVDHSQQTWQWSHQATHQASAGDDTTRRGSHPPDRWPQQPPGPAPFLSSYPRAEGPNWSAHPQAQPSSAGSIDYAEHVSPVYPHDPHDLQTSAARLPGRSYSSGALGERNLRALPPLSIPSGRPGPGHLSAATIPLATYATGRSSLHPSPLAAPNSAPFAYGSMDSTRQLPRSVSKGYEGHEGSYTRLPRSSSGVFPSTQGRDYYTHAGASSTVLPIDGHEMNLQGDAYSGTHSGHRDRPAIPSNDYPQPRYQDQDHASSHYQGQNTYAYPQYEPQPVAGASGTHHDARTSSMRTMIVDQHDGAYPNQRSSSMSFSGHESHLPADQADYAKARIPPRTTSDGPTHHRHHRKDYWFRG